MQGHGSVKHLDELIENPGTVGNFSQLVNPATKLWGELDNVYCHVGEQLTGELTVGFGYKARHYFGPELGFGYEIIQKAQQQSNDNDTYLIIKTAFAEASLAGDFRPQASGITAYSPPPLKGDDGNVDASKKPGHRLTEMITILQDTIDNLQTIVPTYDGEYSVEAFHWLHGLTDAASPDMLAEYETNLLNFIQEIRDELKKPDLPFFIGELGMQGISNVTESHMAMRDSQRIVAGSTSGAVFVQTALFVPENNPTEYEAYQRNEHRGSEHYHGRADTVYNIGKSFAAAVLQYQKELSEPAVPSPTAPPAPTPGPTDAYIPILETRGPTVEPQDSSLSSESPPPTPVAVTPLPTIDLRITSPTIESRTPSVDDTNVPTAVPIPGTPKANEGDAVTPPPIPQVASGKPTTHFAPSQHVPPPIVAFAAGLQQKSSARGAGGGVAIAALVIGLLLLGVAGFCFYKTTKLDKAPHMQQPDYPSNMNLRTAGGFSLT